ncbi:MAG: hypothetical protein Kow0092_09170 [Deferrisomatales bacterium]
MAESTQGIHIPIKKYANRRLYDTVHSRYVNLKQIAELVKAGHTVEVVDASSGEDLTKVILTQIILEEEKEQRNLLPTEFLHQIIQYGESAYEDFLEKFLTAGMTAYQTAQERMEALFRGWMRPWVDLGGGGPPQTEIEALKAKIAELEARLADRDRPSPPADD